MKIYETLSNICLDLDIYEFGVTHTRPFSDISGRLLDFKISAFTEANIQARIDPLATMQGAKTIICALFPYKGGENSDNLKPETWGKIVSGDIYYGCDYHIYVKKHLNAIAERLKERFGGNYMCFCDTGPLVDKEIAFRCGLVRYGKNTLAINSRYGSMFYIGYILTDLQIEHNDAAVTKRLYDGCEGCNKCEAACPANAIIGGILYHERCISYISQKRGQLTLEEAASLNTLYGCHICQNVCPSNKPSLFYRYVELDACINLSNREFKRAFKDTAACWIGNKTIERNALILKGKHL